MLDVFAVVILLVLLTAVLAVVALLGFLPGYIAASRDHLVCPFSRYQELS